VTESTYSNLASSRSFFLHVDRSVEQDVYQAHVTACRAAKEKRKEVLAKAVAGAGRGDGSWGECMDELEQVDYEECKQVRQMERTEKRFRMGGFAW